MTLYNPKGLPATGRCPAQSKHKLKICNQPLFGEEKFCIWHDPDRAEDRKQLSSQMGKLGRKKQLDNASKEEQHEQLLLMGSIENAGHVRAILEEEIREVKQKVRDPVKRAAAVARLTSVVLQSMKIADSETELQRVRDQMKELVNSSGKSIDLVWPDSHASLTANKVGEDAPAATSAPKLVVVE